MFKSVLILLSLLNSINLYGTETLEAIEVSGPVSTSSQILPQSSHSVLNGDSASLLDTVPGISLQKGGGLSSLPVIQGMADDRINIRIDGAAIASSCPNHMNPAMSYIDPSKISTIEVMAGITPVSAGGDSIGGSIVVKSRELTFATLEEKLKQTLNLRTFYKSNNENQGASLQYAIATEKTFIGYSGFDERANNYRNGDGKRLKSTLFNQNNQKIDLGRKLDDGVLHLKLSRAIVPFQGFVNQRMDMVDNSSNFASLGYKGKLGDAIVDSTLFYQITDHEMDILPSERGGEMPMITRSNELGFNFKASFDLSSDHVLSVGSDYDRYRLNDWWPGFPDVTVIMGPGEFQSIRNGRRDRLGFFAETDSDWSARLTTNVGIRTDIVMMNTDDVQGYNDTDNLPADAAAFNGRSHDKRDHNYDATMTAKYELSPNFDLEAGIGRKTRSPNLYERYAWAGTVTDPTDPLSLESMSASMDMLMINWAGDGNGYVGNLGLKPEVAHKISVSFVAHDEHSKKWEARITPYYSDINNFIDADLIGSYLGNNFLRFANHDAVIFGTDFSGIVRITPGLSLKLISSYTRGYRKDGKSDLYHLMPLNGKMIIDYKRDKFGASFTSTFVDEKNQTNEMRNEQQTAGYALIDAGLRYQITRLIRAGVSVDNILDKNYQLPLGGVDLVNSTSRSVVSGLGRSVNLSFEINY